MNTPEPQPFNCPQPPQIDAELLVRCRESGDYAPVLFQWYQFVGLLCCFFSSIRHDSADIKELPALHYSVLIALLNRCTRLMHANTALSHEGLFGETTAILDRCIFESVVKLKWLCEKGDAASFERLLLDGLRPDIEFKKLILEKVAARDNTPLVIETRMLASIDNYLATIPTTEEVVAATPKLPDLATMITTFGGDRLAYVIGQRIGSHAVHGTWPSLRHDYLEEHDGQLGPRDHNCPTHQNQYVFVMSWVLDAMGSFITFVAVPGEGLNRLRELLDAVQLEITTLNTEVVGNDFEKAEAV